MSAAFTRSRRGTTGAELSNMAARRRKMQVFFVLAALAAAAGCDRAGPRGPTAVTTTSATAPEDQGPNRNSHPRTVDAAGFVDNGGRTSSETSRSELSGMRATETGSERVTGTPGSGFPLPIEPKTSTVESGERPRPPETGRNTTAGPPSEQVTGRLTQALCDRETSCGRVGASKAWPSVATCTSSVRVVVRQDLSAMECPDGHDPGAVTTCLSAIRLASCDKRVDGLATLPECDVHALCIHR